MSWQLSIVFLFIAAFACGLLLAISGMLALRIVSAIAGACRWLFARARALQ